MPLRIGFEPPAGRIDGDVLADAGHDVLQRPLFGRMIEHVVHRDEWNETLLGDHPQAREAAIVVAAIEHAGGEPDRTRRGSFEAGEGILQVTGSICDTLLRRHHDQVEARDVLEQVVEVQDAFGLLAAALADREQAREMPPGLAVLRISQNVGRPVGEHQPRADDELQGRLAGAARMLVPLPELMIRAHHARDAVAVRDADAGKPESGSAGDEFLRMRRAAQKREMSRDGELRIGRSRRLLGFRRFLVLSAKFDDVAHANTPCMNQRVGSFGSRGHSRKSHTRTPSRLSTRK